MGSPTFAGSHFAIAILKLLLAGVYAKYKTSIFDDEGIEQAEDLFSPPLGNKLFLKFRELS